MRGKKSILFVMNTMGRAGAERALIELMRVLVPAKYRISLYVLIPRGELFEEVPEHVHILNRKTDSRSVLTPGGKLAVGSRLAKASVRGGSLAKAVRRIRDMKRTGDKVRDAQTREKILRRLLADGSPGLPDRYDLAAAYLEGPATWYVAEKVHAGRKAAFLHIDYRRAGYSNDLDNGCYSAFDRIYAVSGEVRKNFLEVYPEYEDRTKLFFNIVNREHIRRRAQEPGGFADNYGGIRLLTVGRLYYQKGYDIAVKTAALLKKQGYEFRWYVLGEGEEEKNIRHMIREYGLEDTFVLLGAMDNPYPYFSQADIYVCTSRFEGKSIVIEEAQALGKPVVATGCTGVAEQIDQGTDGVITDGTDPELLAEAVGRLIKEPALCRKYGEAAYNKEQLYEKGLNDFLELAGSRAE